MENFWDFSNWGFIFLLAVLFASMLVANMIKKGIPFLRNSLIPTSVLGGIILLIISSIYTGVTGKLFFDTAIFAGKGSVYLELIAYHTLALGFIASSLKTSQNKLSKKRTNEIFNTGVTTVSTYLLQGIFGLGITMIAALVIAGFFPAAGVLLPFGFGQGTGQALNYGGIYETDFGFAGGKHFGLSIAALGFLCASLGGVIALNIMKRRGKIQQQTKADEGVIHESDVQGENEIPMQESIDKLTVQIALIAVTYLLAYLLMWGLGSLLSGMKSIIYGFNFLLGVLMATLVKLIMKFLKSKNIVKKEYTNNFLLTRAGNFFFDLMVVSGIAVIRLDVLAQYWGILLILGVVGLVITYTYNHIVAKVLFPEYAEQQFLAMFGMLTGTASTGVILLREADGDFKTPAADNLVYQSFPAIVFGFPMMFLATYAPKQPLICLIIFIAFFAVMNVILFRKQIFRRKKKSADVDGEASPSEAQENSAE